MKKNPRFRERVYASSYFERAKGYESINDIVNDFPGGPSVQAVYVHIRNNHLEVSREKRIELTKAAITREEVTEAATAEVIKSAQPVQIQRYERALDAYIRQSEEEVLAGRLKVTAQSFLAAVNLKHAIVKSRKDNTTELLKVMAGIARG